MTTTLTPVQQGTVDRARRFHATGGDPHRSDAHNLGTALAHLQLLLNVIDELTGDPAPTHTGEGITGMYWDNLGHGGAS